MSYQELIKTAAAFESKANTYETEFKVNSLVEKFITL